MVGGKRENPRKPSEQEREPSRNSAYGNRNPATFILFTIVRSESLESIRSNEELTLETLALESNGGQIALTPLLIT